MHTHLELTVIDAHPDAMNGDARSVGCLDKAAPGTDANHTRHGEHGLLNRSREYDRLGHHTGESSWLNH